MRLIHDQYAYHAPEVYTLSQQEIIKIGIDMFSLTKNKSFSLSPAASQR